MGFLPAKWKWTNFKLLKSVHFKKTVARISFLSKLWYFLFCFVLKILININWDRSLFKFFQPYGCFESEAELSHRMEVLATLNTLIKDWIKDLSIEKNMPADVAETIGGHVYTFGSYRLGTVNPKLRIPLGNCWFKSTIYGLQMSNVYGFSYFLTTRFLLWSKGLLWYFKQFSKNREKWINFWSKPMPVLQSMVCRCMVYYFLTTRFLSWSKESRWSWTFFFKKL